MNTVIDFQLFFFGESNGFKELHIKYLEYVFFRLSEKCKTKDRLLQGKLEKLAKFFIIAAQGLVFGCFIAPTQPKNTTCPNPICLFILIP